MLAKLADPLTLQILEQQAVTVMAPTQIRQGVADNMVSCEKKTHFVSGSTGKWFCLSGNWENDSIPTAMMGAACGDVAGSVYEWHIIKFKLDHLVPPNSLRMTLS